MFSNSIQNSVYITCIYVYHHMYEIYVYHETNVIYKNIIQIASHATMDKFFDHCLTGTVLQ